MAQNIKSNTVIKDPHTVSGMRWDDTDISGMQSVFDPLYRSVGSSVIQTENLKKFNVHGEKQGVVAVMLGKHDIAILYHEQVRYGLFWRKQSAAKKEQKYWIVWWN